MLTSITFPARGVDATKSPTLISGKTSNIESATNLRIHNGRPRTRHRAIIHKVKGDQDSLDEWQSSGSQATIWYLPHAGQGAHYLGVGQPRIIDSTAGKLWQLERRGTAFMLSKLSDLRGDPKAGICWLTQAENYVLRTHSLSKTLIYDGKQVFESRGWSPAAKADSRFPNFAGPCVYAGGRLWVVIHGRKIIVSDALHQVNVSEAVDLLKFTDQSYDITNVAFTPMASAGNIVGLAVTVDSGTANDSRGQGEVLAMCRNNLIWGIALGVPRSQWSSTQMRRTRSTEVSAQGPLAFVVRDGDILMRTQAGIESMRLLTRGQATIGTPNVDLAADIREWTKPEDPSSLLYCSTANPPRWSRFFVTAGLQLDHGTRRFHHHGWFTINWNPFQERAPSGSPWEGANALPCGLGVTRFFQANDGGRSELWAMADDGEQKSIVEFTTNDGPDLLPDGERPIQWRMMTKRLTASGPHGKSTWGNIRLWVDEMIGDCSVSLFIRTSIDRQWSKAQQRFLKAVDLQGADSADMAEAEWPIDLGKPIQGACAWIQLMLCGSGTMTFDLAIETGVAGDHIEPVSMQACEPVPSTSEYINNPFDPNEPVT